MNEKPNRVAEAQSWLDLDYGEGWATFSWLDSDGIHRSLTIEADGHCSREMPIRSGTGVEIVSVAPDLVRLRFTAQLAIQLDLDRQIEFVGSFPENVVADLRRLAEWLAPHS